MKKYILLVIVVSVVFVAMRYFTADKRTLRIGVECDYAPNNWEENRSGSESVPLINHEGFYADGYDIQIAKIIADSLGYRLEVKKVAWSDLIPALNRKEIDAIFSGMLDTEERKKSIAFSDTYEVSRTEYAVVVNNNSNYLMASNLNDFHDAKFIAQRGTNFDTFIDKIPGAVHVEPVNTVPEMLEALTTHKVDATIINVDTGNTYVRTYRNLTMIRFPEGEGFNLDYTGICAGVRQDDRELLEDINKALRKISARDRQRIMDRTISRMWENL